MAKYSRFDPRNKKTNRKRLGEKDGKIRKTESHRKDRAIYHELVKEYNFRKGPDMVPE